MGESDDWRRTIMQPLGEMLAMSEVMDGLLRSMRTSAGPSIWKTGAGRWHLRTLMLWLEAPMGS